MSASIAALTTAGIQFERGLPRVCVALQPTAPRGRKVLALGALGSLLERYLEREGARLAPCASVLEALRAMAAQTFDAVLVSPDVPGGLDLVRTVKLGGGSASQRSAADRHALVPFFVLPHSGESEWAVIVEAPGLAWLEDEGRLPLASAVLRLDVPGLIKDRLPNA